MEAAITGKFGTVSRPVTCVNKGPSGAWGGARATHPWAGTRRRDSRPARLSLQPAAQPAFAWLEFLLPSCCKGFFSSLAPAKLMVLPSRRASGRELRLGARVALRLPVCLPEEKSQELSCDNRGRRRGKHSSCVLLKHVPGFPGGSDCRVCLQCGRPGFDPWVGKNPWRRERQPTPVFLPGESHRQRSPAGYSPWAHRVGHN